LKRLKILVAERAVIARKIISDAANATQYGVVEHAVPNGNIAIEWLAQCKIDVILMDITIIQSEGTEILSYIKSEYPSIAIILLSNDHPDSSAITLECLKAGSVDFVMKDSRSQLENSAYNFKNHLETLLIQIKLKNCNDFSETALSQEDTSNPSEKLMNETNLRNFPIGGDVDLILIASSTGGPVALDALCRQLSPDLQQSILVVQHMPPEFTNLLAQSLDKKYEVKVCEGKDREVIRKGQIIIAPGGYHTIVEYSKELGEIIRLVQSPFVNGVRPAADVLFKSVSEIFEGKNILVVILTGMGNDGTQGIVELKKRCHCYCITQSESTCVVYGMPKCVYEAGLSDEVADLENIALRINQIALSRGGIH